MRRFAQDCDPPTYSCTSSGRKDAKIAHIKSGVRLTRNPTRFASHVAHQNVRQNRFAITVQQLHIRVTHYCTIMSAPMSIGFSQRRRYRAHLEHSIDPITQKILPPRRCKTGSTERESVYREILRKSGINVSTPSENEPIERLSVVGKRCGFPNANYLKKLFLAETGMTMREWRRNNI